MRIEHDSLGPVEIPSDQRWGAQTERSLKYFAIGDERMPREVIYAIARIKGAAAEVNAATDRLDEERSQGIQEVVTEILEGLHDREFPLRVWQTGSGTQSNMNVNEVIAHTAAEKYPHLTMHPNDHVNLGQSSNDVFPSACHIAGVGAVQEEVLPAMAQLQETLERLSEEYAGLIKVGRTHLQDATPLTLGQEISAWAGMLQASRKKLEDSLHSLKALAIGGTAVGTGLNTSRDFGERVCDILGGGFYSSSNKFHALSSLDALLFTHGALETFAANYHKIANDIRLLSMGPRAGLAEIIIPANEPGSSIMPGKVNPTQAEQATMVAARVMGNHQTISFAASMGHLQLNVYWPVTIYSFLQSTKLLADSIRHFEAYCVRGIRPNRSKIEEHLNSSLMLVTQLTPLIGYEKAAQFAQMAYAEGESLHRIVMRELAMSEEDVGELLDPKKMV